MRGSVNVAPVSDRLGLHRPRTDLCKDGLLDRDLLVMAQKRLTYEHEAYGLHRHMIKGEPLLAFAAAAEIWRA